MDATKKPVRNLSKFCQMPLSRHLARLFPFGLSQSFVAFLGRLYYWRHPSERQLICQTIEQVFSQWGEHKLLRLQGRTFQGIYRHYQEKLFLAYAPETAVRHLVQERLELQGSKALAAALAKGRGVILVTGHFGAVEFLPAALGLHGYPAAVIVRPQTKELARSMANRAALVNLNLIIPENGKVLPAALRALREGRILITEMDEFEMWRKQDNQRVNFLGFSIPGDRTLDVLHKRSQAPILTALVHRQPSRCYRVDMQLMVTPPPGHSVGSQCLQHLEQAIWSAPEQWYQWKEFGKLLATLPVENLPQTAVLDSLSHRLAHFATA